METKCNHEPFEGKCIHCNALFVNGIASPARQWRSIEDQPEFDHRPSRHFIFLVGHREHSGGQWLRQHAGDAFIRKAGDSEELLGYRHEDIVRLCRDGDMHIHSARVTHWRPYDVKWPEEESDNKPTKSGV